MSESSLSEILQAQFAKARSEHRLQGELYLACSGGRDSLSLAWACLQLYKAEQLATLPTLLHVHHGWQAANDDWATAVANFADRFGFACRILPVQLDKCSETAARTARYAAMLGEMKAGDTLMLAHHQSDQAETLLLRLINGAGVQGLSAMKAWQARALPQGGQAWLWRPWLGVSRAAISAFARREQLPFVDDATNVDENFARARVRTQILPQLERINPNAIANIARTSQLCWDATQLLDEVADTIAATLDLGNAPFYSALNIAALQKHSEAKQRMLIHRFMQGDEQLPPSHAITEQVRKLAHRGDNDHATQLYWQGEMGFIICAYAGQIYRYREDVWQALAADDWVQVADFQDKNIFILSNSSANLQLILQNNLTINITKIQKYHHQAVQIGKHSYRAKKLYQRLKIPTWLRASLWLVQLADGRDYVICPNMAWRLSTGEATADLALAWQMAD